MAVHNVLSLLANSKGNLEHAGCFFQQRLDLKRKIHRVLVITCLGGLNRAPCALVCVIDKVGDAGQSPLDAAIRIAAHVGLTVGAGQNEAKSNTSRLGRSKDRQRLGVFSVRTMPDRRVPGVDLWRDRDGSSGTRVDLLNS
jgi:hypothetical protein